MNDDDLIRRGDARRIAIAYSEGGVAAEKAGNAIDALPTVAASARPDTDTNPGWQQRVKVKPLEWEAYDNHPHKLWRAWCDTLGREWIIWIDCPDVDAEKAQVELWRGEKILAALEPSPVTLADALAVPEVAAMVAAADVLLMQHDFENPMRQADFHSDICQCQRCRMDALRAARAAVKGGDT